MIVETPLLKKRDGVLSFWSGRRARKNPVPFPLLLDFSANERVKD